MTLVLVQCSCLACLSLPGSILSSYPLSHPLAQRRSWPGWGRCVPLRAENIPCNKKMKQKLKHKGSVGLGKAPVKNSQAKCWDASGWGRPGMTFQAPAASF